MGDENVCSVCWDKFKCPKLLPCKHTFCISCLQEFLEGLHDKETLVCPLCREPCYVPDKGFEDFPTNYFVPAEKNNNTCQECETLPVSTFCYHCNKSFCGKCNRVHSHGINKSQSDDDNSEIERIAGLPFHLHWPLMHENMKTEYLYEQVSMFVGEFSQTEDGRKSVRCMSLSRNGGVYVLLANNEFLLKYDKHGKILRKIKLLGLDAADVLESHNSVLLVAHFAIKATVAYINDKFGCQYVYFAKTDKFHHIGLKELPNRNVVISGPSHLCAQKCKNRCELSNTSPGIVQIYTLDGKLVREIQTDALENIFIFPTKTACSTKAQTIAVCDTHLRKVVIVDYEGRVRGIYKGWNPFPLFPAEQKFLPISVCSNHDGSYIVADPQLEVLHVLNPYGKFIGILRTKNGESLSDTSSVCVDMENNLWVGHHIQGTTTVLKPSLYINVFNQLRLPILPNLHEALLPNLPGVDEFQLPLAPHLQTDT